MTGGPAAAITKALIDAVATEEPTAAYLRRYLAEHVAASDLWDELDLPVLEELDPLTVSSEAFRTGYGRDLPDAVLLTMVTAADQASAKPAQQGLVRALGAHRLGLSEPSLTSDPWLKWSHLRRVTPHLTLSGHTNGVTSLVFGHLSNGQTILASGGWDRTVRLWDPTTSHAIGQPFIGHTDGVTSVAFGHLSGPTPGSWTRGLITQRLGA